MYSKYEVRDDFVSLNNSVKDALSEMEQDKKNFLRLVVFLQAFLRLMH